MPYDPLKQAEAFEREAERVALAGGSVDEVRKYLRAAAVMRKIAEEEGLSPVNKRATVDRGNMVASHKVAISKGRSKGPFAEACQEAGYTLRGLAKKLGVSFALLSYASRGERTISRTLAERIEKLTKYPASRWKLQD